MEYNVTKKSVTIIRVTTTSRTNYQRIQISDYLILRFCIFLNEKRLCFDVAAHQASSNEIIIQFFF